MNHLLSISVLLLSVFSCQSQTSETGNKLVGGPCEGCEALYEYGEKKLTPTDTLPNYQETEPKLKISGTIYQKDGRTPAENVIVYIYHTNRAGIYETKGGEEGWARRHGFIRGWVKTGKDGKYTFYTFRPAAYPRTSIPEHIHMTIKEPDRNEYYIDEIQFEDDPFLTVEQRKRSNNRAGSGIVMPVLKDGILTIERDIILGLNIPAY